MQIPNVNAQQPEKAGMPFAAQSYATGANGTDGTSSGASSGAGRSTAAVTANDFLQLLVTELKNQDPTANTDPTKYIDQLVQVNSLQQQIQMNQTLDGGPSLTGAGTGVLQELEQINGALDGDLAQPESSVAPAALTQTAKPAVAEAKPAAGGNLSVVSDAKARGAAQAVASALAPKAAASGPSFPERAFRQFAARLKSGAGSR